MTPHKYDHILIHRNPYNNKPITIEYRDPKFIQTRIYFQCERVTISGEKRQKYNCHKGSTMLPFLCILKESRTTPMRTVKVHEEKSVRFTSDAAKITQKIEYLHESISSIIISRDGRVF